MKKYYKYFLICLWFALLTVVSQMSIASEILPETKTFPLSDNIEILQIEDNGAIVEIRYGMRPSVDVVGTKEQISNVVVDLAGFFAKIKGPKLDSVVSVTSHTDSVTNIQIGSGNSKVVVGGKVYTSSSEKPVKIVVTVNKLKELRGNLSGYFRSDVPIERLIVNAHGSGSVDLNNTRCSDLKLVVSGSAETEITSLLKGEVKGNISGAAEVHLAGSFSDIEISGSGASSIVTKGQVFGVYDVELSGTCEVEHHGSIAGGVKKSLSGVSDFVVR
ncbi:MAG: hypothetical protein ACNI27_13250 [Desulfovibrio sp.]